MAKSCLHIEERELYLFQPVAPLFHTNFASRFIQTFVPIMRDTNKGLNLIRLPATSSIASVFVTNGIKLNQTTNARDNESNTMKKPNCTHPNTLFKHTGARRVKLIADAFNIGGATARSFPNPGLIECNSATRQLNCG
jgi:hypothetical protein